MLKARSISVAYSDWEDRLLLACSDGTQVQQLWVTRRMIGRLLKSAAELIEKSSLTASRAPADLRSEVIAFEHQSAMSQPEALRAGGPPAPPTGLKDLGQALVWRLQIDTNPTNFRMVFHGQHTALAETTLGRADLHRLIAVIDQYASAAEWGFTREREWLGSNPAPGGAGGDIKKAS